MSVDTTAQQLKLQLEKKLNYTPLLANSKMLTKISQSSRFSEVKNARASIKNPHLLEDDQLEQYQDREDLEFYLYNKAGHKMNFVRFLSQDHPFRTLKGNAGEGQTVICWLKLSQIEAFMQTKRTLALQSQKEDPYASVIKIIESDKFERKGYLKKKGMNNDTFKERFFLLEQNHLFYFKSERNRSKNFTVINLTNARIKMLDYETLMKISPRPKFPSYLDSKNEHILEIWTDSRLYVL